MTEVVVQRDLVAGGGHRQAFRAHVRAAGQTWTGDDSVDLAELLTAAAADDPELAELVHTGGSLLVEFLEGYRRSARASCDPVKDLIEGRPVSPDVETELASEYVVAIVHWPDKSRAEAQQAGSALQQEVGAEVLATTADCGLVLLVPGTNGRWAARIIKQVKQFLSGNAWLVTAARPRRELRDGFREAEEVLRLVAAGLRPCGAYTVLDVLVEYAVMQDEPVAAELAAMIRPLRDQPVLWKTLTALIDVDYQRNKAARALFVHRSTLDYRLQRIAAVTGWDPTTGRGAQLLTAAVVADALRGRSSSWATDS